MWPRAIRRHTVPLPCIARHVATPGSTGFFHSGIEKLWSNDSIGPRNRQAEIQFKMENDGGVVLIGGVWLNTPQLHSGGPAIAIVRGQAGILHYHLSFLIISLGIS